MLRLLLVVVGIGIRSKLFYVELSCCCSRIVLFATICSCPADSFSGHFLNSSLCNIWFVGIVK